MSKPAVLNVAKILDNSTLIASGDQVSKFHDGDHVSIVGEAGLLDDGTPIIVPKAELLVRANAGKYVILESKSKIEERTETTPKYGFTNPFLSSKTVEVKIPQRIKVREGDISGNPGSLPVSIGDPVIHAADLASYVAHRTEAARTKKDD